MLFGGHVYLEGLVASAGRTRRSVDYMTVMMSASTAADRVMGVASIITVVFGVWLVIDSPVFGFEELFVTIGFVAVIAAFAVSIFVMGPSLKKIKAIVAENGVGDASAVEKMKSLVTLIHVQTLIVAIAFIVMVLKPGL